MCLWKVWIRQNCFDVQMLRVAIKVLVISRHFHFILFAAIREFGVSRTLAKDFKK